MKLSLKFLPLFLILLVGFSSCDELDELTEFDINEDFSTTISVDLSGDSPVTWSENATIDISDSQEIADNLDLIQNVTINSLTYEINNVSGDGTTVTEASISFNGQSISVANLDLVMADANNTIFTIEDTSLLTTIGNSLENDPVITVGLSGTIDAVPVSFDIIVTLDSTVTVDVL